MNGIAEYLILQDKVYTPAAERITEGLKEKTR